MNKYCAALCAASLALSGCVNQGPPAVYTQAGVAAPPKGVGQYPNANPLTNFQIAAEAAQSGGNQATYQQFMRAGFSLIYIRCNEYFDKKGSDQATANLVRDSIAPLVAVISGLLALHTYSDPSNADHAISLLTLGSTTAVSGLDVYSKHFLFGAENIESVREMVKEELVAHSSRALEIAPENIEEAALQITDNQRICLPSHILMSTRGAIANGKFAAAVSGTGLPVDADLLDKLGQALNLTPPVVTDTQAGLFYATGAGDVRSPAELKFVRAKLSSLPEAANPISDDGKGGYAIKPDFPFAKLKSIFDGVSGTTRAYLESRTKAVMVGATLTAKADEAAVKGAGGIAAMMALRGDPDMNLRNFTASSSSDYDLPGSSSQTLRRVRVTAK